MSSRTRATVIVILSSGLLLLGGLWLRSQPILEPANLPTRSQAHHTVGEIPVSKPQDSIGQNQSSQPIGEVKSSIVEDRQSTYRRLSTWQERNKIIEEIPRDQVHLFQDFLVEVAEGKEVPALRAAALDRLCQLCDRPIQNEVVLQRLASRLATDADPAVRARLAISLGAFQSQVGIADTFLVNTYAEVLMGDNHPKVRAIAAQRLGGLLEPVASLAALRAALPLEQDGNVKKSLQSAIEEAEERLKDPR